MIHFDAGDTPEQFWYYNLKKYRHEGPAIGFPENITVASLMKMSHQHIVLYKGHLDNGDSLVITYPALNNAVKNFIGIGIADCDYRADTNVQVYELDYNQPMTDDFVLNLLTQSHGWDIKEYGDLSGY